MADRTDLLHEVPAPRTEAAEQHAPLAWWHLRSWRMDRRVMARVREGLQAMVPRPGEHGELYGAAEAYETGEPHKTGEPYEATESYEVSEAYGLSGPRKATEPYEIIEAYGASEPYETAVGLRFAGPAVGPPVRPEPSAEGPATEGTAAEGPAAEETAGQSPARQVPGPRECPAEVPSVRECPAGVAGAQPPADAPAVAPAGPLTDPVVEAIRSTFAIVVEAGDAVPGYFYGQLFARHPRLRGLFPPAMDNQRDRLFKALIRIVESLSTPDEMATYLAQLGRDHRKYGVMDPAMYEAVGAALQVTLRRFAGPAFTPAAEQAWMEAYAAFSALMIQGAAEAGVSAPASWSAEVVDIEERFRGMAVLTIALDQGMRFEVGQHVTVQHPRWPRVWRPYSIAGCPREDGLVQLHVKAVPGGWVSNALVKYTEPGSELVLGPPMGTMTLSRAGDRDLVCVAGGTGLAPIKAIIEQAVRDSAACPRRIHLFCGARRREELYDLPDLWRLTDAWPGLQVIPVTSDDRAFDGMQGNVGRVAARYLPHRECEAYVAGPPAMVRETIRVLARAGLPRGRIHYDDALLANTDPGPPERSG